MKHTSILALSALIAAATTLGAATITADFTGGTGTSDASHQFVGTAGNGWADGWLVTDNGKATFSQGIVNDWLEVSSVSTGTSSGTNRGRTYIARKYDTAAATAIIDVTKAYTVSFSIRFDLLTGFNKDGDYIGIFDATRYTTNSVGDGSQSWGVQIRSGALQADGSGGNLITFAEGNYTGATNTTTFVSSGITVEKDKTYTITIEVNPTNSTYTGSVVSSSGAEYTTPTPLTFRQSASTLGTDGRYIHFNTLLGDNADSWEYAINGITISQVIPEPTTVAALAGAAVLALAAVFRRRR